MCWLNLLNKVVVFFVGRGLLKCRVKVFCIGLGDMVVFGNLGIFVFYIRLLGVERFVLIWLW